MYELTSCEMQGVSGGGFASSIGVVSGYNQGSIVNTIIGGTAVLSAYAGYRLVTTDKFEPEMASGILAVFAISTAHEIFMGYCTGVGMAYLAGNL